MLRAWRPDCMFEKLSIVVSATLLVALATDAFASEPVAGKSLVIKDDATRRSSRSLKVGLADPAIALPLPGSASDPTASGATGGGARLSVSNPVTGETAVYSLPASGWTGSGTPPGATGYK